MKVTVVNPFSIGSGVHKVGDVIEVTKEQAGRLKEGGFIKMKKSPKNKMVNSAPKKKRSRKNK